MRSKTGGFGNTLAKPILARAATFPVSILLGLLTSYVLINRFDVGTYATYALLASLLPLLSFLDLGIGGAVTNWSARSTTADKELAQARVLSGLRVSLFVAVVGALFATGLAAVAYVDGATFGPTHLWIAAIVILLNCVNIPASVCCKLLIGTARSSTWILVQCVQPIVAAVVVLIASVIDEPAIAVLSPAIALIAMCGLGAVLGLRSFDLPMKSIFGSQSRFTKQPVLQASWPMLVILFANPIALYSDRFLLVRFGAGTGEVAEYSLAAQFYLPILTFVSVAGMALWPHFAGVRAGRIKGAGNPVRVSAIFAGVGLALAVGVSLLAPFVASAVSTGQIELPALLLVGFGASLVVQAAQVPLGMYMLEGREPRLQALMVTVMLCLKLSLTVLLTPTVGPAGPVVATAVSIALCQLLPQVLYVAALQRKAVNDEHN